MLGIFVLGMTVPWINAKVSLVLLPVCAGLLMKSLFPLASQIISENFFDDSNQFQ